MFYLPRQMRPGSKNRKITVFFRQGIRSPGKLAAIRRPGVNCGNVIDQHEWRTGKNTGAVSKKNTVARACSRSSLIFFLFILNHSTGRRNFFRPSASGPPHARERGKMEKP